MRGTLPLLLALASVPACSSTGGLPRGPVSWSPGLYRLEAVIEYSQDFRGAAYTARETYTADLIISQDGSMELDSSYGICRDPLPAQVQRDLARGRRSFDCGDAIYWLRPAAGTVRGEMVVTVREERRRSEGCARYTVGPDGEPECEENSWRVDSQITDKRARLYVSPL